MTNIDIQTIKHFENTYFETKTTFKVRFALEILMFILLLVNIIIQIKYQYKYKFYESKLQAYIELVTITGQLASEHSDINKFNELKVKFYSIYYGKSQLFEDRYANVKASIEKFKDGLELINVDTPIYNQITACTNLKLLALKLATHCAEELGN